MTPIDDWMHAFAATRGGWAVIRARRPPLYGHRCSREEFSRLEHALRADLSRSNFLTPSPSQSAAVVLFAAEWWRRRYEAGAWAYRHAFEAFGATPPPYNLIARIVEDGLDFFGRKVRVVDGTRHRLATLIAEGGLPISAIRNDGSRVRDFFRAVLEEVGSLSASPTVIENAVSRNLHRLPMTLQFDAVRTLCVDIAANIFSLQARVPDRTADPIAHLDATAPNWRDDLPLLLEDEDTTTLLNRLVVDAKAAVVTANARLRFFTSLVEHSPGVFLVERHLDASWISREELAQALGASPDSLPVRLRLFAHPTSGEPLELGLASIQNRAGEMTYRFEPPRLRPVVIADAGDVLLGAIGLGTRSFEPAIIRGSELGALPWAFADGENATPRRLLGVGSVRTQASSLIVAVDAEQFRWDEEPQEELGALLDGGRTVYRLTKPTRVTTLDGEMQCTLRTAAQVSARFTSWPRGVHPHGIRGRFPTFAGFPELHVDNGTRLRKAAASELRWRPYGHSGPWLPRAEQPLGDVRVRMLDDGELVAEHVWTILPEGATGSVTPGADDAECGLSLRGFGTNTDLIVDPDGLREVVPQENGDLLVRASGPGLSELCVRAQFAPNRAATLCIPFAARGCRVLDRDGKRVEPDQLVSINELSSLSARAFGYTSSDRVQATCQLIDSSHTVDRALRFDERSSVWQLPLRELQSEVELLLSLSRGVDTQVRVTVGPLGLRHGTSAFRVANYQLEIDRDDARSALLISSDSLQTLPDAMKRRLRARATAISTLTDARPISRIDDECAWRFDVDTHSAGAWLLTIFDGDRCVARPLRWFVQPKKGEAVPPPPSLLQRAVEEGNTERRQRMLLDALSRLTSGDDEAGWTYLERALATLDYLPADTFDVIALLARSDSALIGVMLRQPRANWLRLIWNGMERLPFLWETVSLRAWKTAAASHVASLRAVLTSAGLDAQEHGASHFATFNGHLREEQAMHTVIELLHGVDPQVFPRLEQQHLIDSVPNAVLREAALNAFLRPVWQDVLRRHDRNLLGDRWPQVSADTRGSRRLERLAEWLRAGPVPMLDCLEADLGSELCRDIAYAPLIAAFIAVHRESGDDIPLDVLANLKRAKGFDPEWFEIAWRFFAGVLWAESQSKS